MKKIFPISIFLFLLLAFSASEIQAQNVQGNEWIKYNNTYKKFKIAEEGAYKITYAQLNNLGFTSIPGSQFAIFRDGKEVPIYVSTNGVFSPSDFIFFYGSPANGVLHKELYENPDNQPDTFANLISDSAVYFLTYDNSSHRRLNLINNSIPTPLPTAAPYCWFIERQANPKQYISLGKSYDYTGEYFYSSVFDVGEGYAHHRGTTVNAAIWGRNMVMDNSLSVKVSFVVSPFSKNGSATHNLELFLNNNPLFDTTYSTYSYIRKEIDIPIADLNNNSNIALQFKDAAGLTLFSNTLRYPRNLDFRFDNKASFEIPQGYRFVETNGFNAGSTTTPYLFDFENNKIYSGTIVSGRLRFYLDNDASRGKFFLTNENMTQEVSAFQNVQFRDYTQATAQGDYIILSHQHFINASPNYVQQFADYRSGSKGGSHQPVIVDVTELYNQFAYGYDYDPLAIRRFIRFAESNWSITPEYLFIIGKGVFYYEYQRYLNNIGNYEFKASVPTWGHPGSDNLLSASNTSQKATLATGRLSAYTNIEIGDYLEKLKSYEEALKISSNPSTRTELWKKQALHIVGASNVDLQYHLNSALDNCKQIYEDTLIGGSVKTIAKNTTDPTQGIKDPSIDEMMNNGINIMGYYGHASADGFEYNLNNPDFYNSAPRFPIFLAFGCDVSQIFTLSEQKTISENYIRSNNAGAIAMVADDNFGYTGTLPQYMKEFYNHITHKSYGKSFGQQFLNMGNDLLTSNYGDFMKIHVHCHILQGDPALAMFSPDKPDFAVEQSGLSATPSNLTTSIDSFELKAMIYNLAQAATDTLMVTLEHTRPGQAAVVYRDTVYLNNGLHHTDSVYFKIPINIDDIGMNNYTIKIDSDNRFDEISEQNNQATLQLFIYENTLVPVYPANYSIVYEQGVTLKASTLNAFAPLSKYHLEIDTTTAFNSTLLQKTEIMSMGGVVKWQPNLTLQDSVVYYWRTAADTLINGERKWTISSFIYLENGSDGWNQSHFYQFLDDELHAIELPESTRKFSFTPIKNKLVMENRVTYSSRDYDEVHQTLNDVRLQWLGCVLNQGTVQIMVIDGKSGIPWANTPSGKYGAKGICGSKNIRSFEYPVHNLAGRDSAIKMIERVPEGDYIMISNVIYSPKWAAADGSVAKDWQADTNVLGSGKSLYHAIKNLGFTDIDLFDSKKAFIFFRKKGDNSYPVYQEVSTDSSKITLNVSFDSYLDSGSVNSTIIGPALEWQTMRWEDDKTVERPQNDIQEIHITGIRQDGTKTHLYSGKSQDTSLSFIDAKIYPNIILNWKSKDSIDRTSANMKYWRVLFQPVPEAALNAAAHFHFTDSIEDETQGKLEVAIENISPFPMDSMLVKYRIIDEQNKQHEIASKRYKKLNGGDTLIAHIEFDPSRFPGKNILFIEANPGNDQPEQFHPNNIGYLNFSKNIDNVNPLLDVTFDGVHILDKDIVSAKPFIKILLKDNNIAAPLNDTSLIEVHLLYPNETTPKRIPFDGTTCVFFGQDNSKKQNEAKVEFRPQLSEDGIYKLIVSGKDNAGNTAGGPDRNYEINFTVENKASITNVLNYPNPFSTSTQFLFTMTGSEIPSQFKIQILSATGKVVREITKQELGHLHIGRNMTEYRWDGRDQYGQLLGNGVYLYRVVTSIDGESVEHRSNAAVDKYFKKGYGKLYIMR